MALGKEYSGSRDCLIAHCIYNSKRANNCYHAPFRECIRHFFIHAMEKEYSGSRDGVMGMITQCTPQKGLLRRLITVNNEIVGVPMNSQHVIVSSDQCPLSRQVRFSELASENT